MKTKIILGLGLCLLLTVINLHRAMDNYGITDAKFKVGVLADESSSAGTTPEYTNLNGTCYYNFWGLLPLEEIRLFSAYNGTADYEGNLTIPVPLGEIYCEKTGNDFCYDSNCEIPGGGDIYSITQGLEYGIWPN